VHEYALGDSVVEVGVEVKDWGMEGKYINSKVYCGSEGVERVGRNVVISIHSSK